MSGRVINMRPTIPALRDALLDANRIGARLRYRFNPDSQRDILTIEWEGLATHDVLSDDISMLICHLEGAGFRNVTVSRLKLALECIPHTAEYITHREYWVAG